VAGVLAAGLLLLALARGPRIGLSRDRLGL
jgi:hypothetical protein